MLRHKGLLLALIFALSAWPASVLLHAQEGSQDDSTRDTGSHVRIVRLSYLQGGVELDNNQGFQNATMNVPITEGDRLMTRSDGWAEVQFEDGSTLRLAPGSQVTFSQLGRNSEGGTVSAVDLDQGEAEFKLTKHDNGEFAVTARNKTIVLKHSGRFRVTTTNSEPLEVAVFKGEVAISDSVGEPAVAVKKNETFSLDELDPAKYDLEKRAEADELDQWGKQRDEMLSAYDSSGDVGSYPRSPYQYGLSDLSYYGTYYNVPGYGYCWQPYGVNPGWDPFMNGYWVFSPIYGYSWVSAYPWGWLPYRYGGWVFAPGYGWLWQPGGWNYWNRTPWLVNPPPGFHPPTPPAQPRVTGPVRMETGRPGRVQSKEVNPGVQPKTPAISSGSEQVQRMETRPERGRRVFTNETVEGPTPQADRNVSQPSGAVRMERTPSKPGMSTGQGQVSKEGAPSAPPVGAQPSRPGAMQPASPQPSRPQPSGPVIRSEPRPAPAPRSAPPSAAPATPPSPPPSAPPASRPPSASAPAPRMEPAPSRPSFSSSSTQGKPK